MDDYAYVTTMSGGLQVISVADKAHPTKVGFFDTAGTLYRVHVVGGYAYIADDDGGLLILRFTGGPCYDFDGDGQVDIDDIMRVASRWRTSCDSPDPDNNLDTPNYDPLYDIDDDCDIDIVDIMLVVVHWGESCP